MLMYELIRSLGLVAYLAFSLSMALGIASLSGGLTDEAIDRRVIRQLVHRSAAVVGLGALLAHLSLTVIDTYVSTSVSAVVIPFTAGYKTLALGIGSLAMYAFVVSGASGWLRLSTARLMSEQGWRRLHRVAYAGWALCLLHGVLAGPDLGQPWALAVYALGIVMVVVGYGVHRAGVRHVLRRDLTGAFHFREVR